MPENHASTMPIDAGLTGPIRVDSGRRAPMRTPLTTKMTSKPSSTGTSEPTRYVSDCVLDATPSQMTSTIVCTAMPPMRLPAARPRWPLEAAEMVIASSGRLPAIASRMTPPSASPRPKRRSMTSVVFESAVPAIHVAIAPAPKTTTKSGVDRDPTSGSLTKASVGLPAVS